MGNILVNHTYINDLLIHYDIEGFIENGEPQDEYLSEAKDIASALNMLERSQLNSENVKAIIAIIWMKNFNLNQNEVQLRMGNIEKLVNDIIK